MPPRLARKRVAIRRFTFRLGATRYVECGPTLGWGLDPESRQSGRVCLQVAVERHNDGKAKDFSLRHEPTVIEIAMLRDEFESAFLSNRVSPHVEFGFFKRELWTARSISFQREIRRVA